MNNTHTYCNAQRPDARQGTVTTNTDNKLINRLDIIASFNPHLTDINPQSPLSVGNGRFCYTADITGMQTLYEEYSAETPLCTMAEWGWQEDIINAILEKKDVLAIMPTGAGKSLCYQVPAMMLSGITVVISPLISLMQDQVKSLNDVGINAAYVNSTLSESEIDGTLNPVPTVIYNVPRQPSPLIYLPAWRTHRTSHFQAFLVQYI